MHLVHKLCDDSWKTSQFSMNQLVCGLAYARYSGSSHTDRHLLTQNSLHVKITACTPSLHFPRELWQSRHELPSCCHQVLRLDEHAPERTTVRNPCCLRLPISVPVKDVPTVLLSPVSPNVTRGPGELPQSPSAPGRMKQLVRQRHLQMLGCAVANFSTILTPSATSQTRKIWFWNALGG